MCATAAACVLATACYGPPVQSPQTRITQETPIRVPQNAQNKVDILFMVDNSQSMDAMQTELRARFGDFLSVFDDLAACAVAPTTIAMVIAGTSLFMIAPLKAREQQRRRSRKL